MYIEISKVQADSKP